MSKQQIHARLSATRDLLQQISIETHRTVRDILICELDHEEWEAYRKLSQCLDSLAMQAAAFADRMRPQGQNPQPTKEKKYEQRQRTNALPAEAGQ